MTEEKIIKGLPAKEYFRRRWETYKLKPSTIEKKKAYKKIHSARMMAEYRAKNPLAMKKLRARLEAGQKISLKGKICEVCNSKENLHRHHDNYDKPLEVRILCRVCHDNLHFNRPTIPKN